MSVVKEPVSGSNPFYGCAILIIAACTFGGIIGYTLYSGYKQNKEIDSFTVHDAPALASSVLTDATREALQKKLDAFSTEAKAGKPATLTLTLEELNQVITLAGEKKIGDYDYRNVVHFTSVDDKFGRLYANIRWQMNNLPLSNAPDRFLVGYACFIPKIENGSFDVYLESVDVPGKTVSPGFIGQLQNIPWLAVSKNNKDVAEVLKHVGAVSMPEGRSELVFEANAGK